MVYYVTFRHRRALEDAERDELLRALTRLGVGRPNVLIACVLPEATELMCLLRENARGEIVDLSAIVEKAKAKTGRLIMKNTGERFPPFYVESYDRIVRDRAEYEERWQSILASPVEAELAEEPERYRYLFVGENLDGFPIVD